MMLPGRNTLGLCPKALCDIVQQHLNADGYAKNPPVRVNSVRVRQEGAGTSYEFELTTSAEPAEAKT